MHSRRDFAKIAVAAIPLARSLWGVNSTIHGVRMGVQSASFTFSGIGIEGIIKTMVDLGLAEIDVMSEHVENFLGAPVPLPGAGRPGPWARRGGAPGAPGGAPPSGPGGRAGFGRGGDPAVREALRKWRMDIDLDKFRGVGKRFTDAGLRFYSYNLSFNDSFTDDEIDKGFLMTKALGTRIITASSPASIFPRIAPFAEKHDVIVAMHNHTNGPAEFEQAMAASKKIWVNLDVGHFFASGYDPIAYLKEHHARITNIHVKDRKKDRGAEMPFGEGDTPLKEVLQLVKKEKYDFPVCIEYVGPDGPAVELKRCFDYCKAALA
uniref:Xylose isomerase domain protein TIM barrel n=1 Tax=Solibacter usitatus (strain Ellin6076) TaxID=234267 RepID=Q026L4_SOLUE